MSILLKGKELTPDKMGVANNSPYTKEKLVTAVSSSLASANKSGLISPEISAVCSYMLEKSVTGNKFNISSHKNIVPDQQFKIILKDFGEICSPLYLLSKNETEYSAVKFPSRSNERLIDFTMVKKNSEEVNHSAKTGKGGAPALSALSKEFDKIDTSKPEFKPYKQAVEVLQCLNTVKPSNSTDSEGELYIGPLLAGKLLKLSSYEGLLDFLDKKGISSLTNGIPRQAQLQEAMARCGNGDNFMKEVSQYYVKAKYTPDVAKTKRMIDFPETKYKTWGALHFPITSQLIKWLNDDNNKAKDVLTYVANKLKVTQIYCNLKGSNIEFTVKEFKDEKFAFHSPSSAPRPTNNRIGFTMK